MRDHTHAQRSAVQGSDRRTLQGRDHRMGKRAVQTGSYWPPAPAHRAGCSQLGQCCLPRYATKTPEAYPPELVCRKFSNFLRCALFCSGQGIDTAQMRPHGVRRDDRIAEDRRLHRLAVRKNSPNFRAVITCCVMCRQMPARGEAADKDLLRVDPPFVRPFAHEPDALRGLGQRLLAARVLAAGVEQDEHLQPHVQKGGCRCVGLAHGAEFIRAARADDHGGAAQRRVGLHFLARPVQDRGERGILGDLDGLEDHGIYSFLNLVFERRARGKPGAAAFFTGRISGAATRAAVCRWR